MATVDRESCTLLLVLVATLSLAAQQVELPFHTDSEHQVVLLEAAINGRPARLVLDTGASATIAGQTFLGLRDRDLKQARFQDDQAGITGNGAWMDVKLQVGDIELKRRVFVMKLESVSERVGERVDGLLGLDVLRQFKRLTIDWERQKVVLER
jgi:hypothetical protein